ncbi:MAG: sulfurtransferase TusA family protein [Candidatus Heimdallarchaeota archaeon]|nr:sulfurtransferase TusA family protein [Candidatus Heimdallarchaeota archaeon]
MEYEVKETIDARGSMCPGPLMELVRAIKEAEVGDIIDLLSSDAGSPKDIPAWLDKTGHELVEIRAEGDFNHIVVKKGEKKQRRRRRSEE